MTLRSLDLFSGIGGFALALRSIAEPVAYCELDPDGTAVMKRNMALGRIPDAPVMPDVRALHARDVPRFDMIVAGWPCQDISSIGLKRGLAGERSGLIREVVRLVDEGRPDFLFFENVPGAVDVALPYILRSFVVERGYDARWLVLPAAAVGALHARRRFFCLLVRRGRAEAHDWGALPRYAPFPFARAMRSRRMVVCDDERGGDAAARQCRNNRIKRCAMCGNSVVPDCARAAFVMLASGFAVADPAKALAATSLRVAAPAEASLGPPAPVPAPGASRRPVAGVARAARLPQWGVCTGGGGGKAARVRALASPPPLKSSPGLGLVLDPALYSPPRGHVRKSVRGAVSDAIREPVALAGWSTPRTQVGASHVLSARTMRDLGTQARFERGTRDDLRGGQLDPEFCEQLMGFSAGHTLLEKGYRAVGYYH